MKLVPELLRLNAAQSVYDFVSRFFRDPQLRTVFSFHPLFIGGNPFRASAIYSIVPYLERQGGVWFARGGMYALVEAMHALFDPPGRPDPPLDRGRGGAGGRHHPARHGRSSGQRSITRC